VTNLATALEEAARAGGFAAAPALICGDDVRTHAEVHDGAARAATVLAQAGARPGDRVLVAANDGPGFVLAFLGAVRLGAVAVPVNPLVTAADHAYLVADARPRVVVCEADLHRRFADAASPALAVDELVAAVEGAEPSAAAPAASTDAAYAQYTSGTTGPPKAAVHAHGHPLAYFEAFARPALGLGPADVCLSVSKLYFAYGLGNSLFYPLLAGCAAVLHPGRPRPADVAALVDRHRVTVLYSVPTFYAHLVAGEGVAGTQAAGTQAAGTEAAGTRAAGTRAAGTRAAGTRAAGNGEGRAMLPSLRVAVSAGEALTPALAERVRRHLGCPVLDGLGSTEVGQTFASNTLHQWRDGTVGRALDPYRVAVRDDAETEVPPGVEGTLWVAGPSLLLGYLGRPEATAGVLVDGWLRTGDRALLDHDGFLHLRGRVDDVELVGGICVAPAEVEAVLMAHPAVTEVAVAGVRDGHGASRLEAYVVPGPAAPPDGGGRDEVAEELRALARAELAAFKVPAVVVWVDALPRTPTGKLRRFVLRSGAWTAPAGAGGDRSA